MLLPGLVILVTGSQSPENSFMPGSYLARKLKTHAIFHEKMNSFSVVRKKTPFQKHREEEEAKKKRAEDEAARLYEEFVESFQGDNTPGSKAFVRGGTINPNERLKTDGEGGNSKDGVSVPKKGSR